MAEKSEGEYQMEQMLADEAGRPEDDSALLVVDPAMKPILSDILAELAHIEAGGGITLARYNTLSDYRRAVRDAVNALMQAKAVRPR